jgi:hypothetical protein
MSAHRPRSLTCRTCQQVLPPHCLKRRHYWCSKCSDQRDIARRPSSGNDSTKRDVSGRSVGGSCFDLGRMSRRFATISEGDSVSLSRLNATGGPRSLIPALFRCSGPSAIVRPVVSIHVDAIDGVFVSRATPHVLEESFVGISPAVTNLDASAAVVAKADMARVVASRLHGSPNVVFVGHAELGALAVSSGAIATQRPFSSEASAAFHSAVAQVATPSVDRATAVALAVPDYRAACSSDRACRNESSETLSSEVGCFHGAYFNSCH